MSLSANTSEVLLLDDGFEALIDKKAFPFTLRHLSASGELENSQNIKAVITNGAIGLPEKFLNALPALEIISVFGVGIDRIPLEKVRERKIKISTTSGVNADEVADSALMFLLNLKRNFLENIAWMKNGSWEKVGEPPLGHSVKGSKVGIVGFGAIGQAIAHRVNALGASIRYYNRSERGDQFPREENLEKLAEWADSLILAIPGTPETFQIIDANILEKLGHNGFLVNIARGSVVDEKALIHALRNNIIKGAGLDVFQTEPAINPDFYTLTNCLIQPHQGSAAWETRQAMAVNVTQNLQAHFAQKPLITPLRGFA